jgi:hypothetical protein
MHKTLVALGAWLLVGAAPTMAQDPGQPANGAATESAQPKAGTGVQIDVVPLIRSLIKRAKPKPEPAVQSAGQVPGKPAEAAPAAVVDPPAPSPAATVPTMAAASQPSDPPAMSPTPRPRVDAAAGASDPSRPPAHALDTRPVVASRDPVLSPPPTESPEPAIAHPVAVAPTPIVVQTAPVDPQPPDRTWLLAAIFGLLAIAIAAAAVAIRHRRLVQRTQRMLSIEPRLDLGRGGCSASGLALAGASDG